MQEVILYFVINVGLLHNTTFTCSLLYGYGSDGSVSSAKNIIKILSEDKKTYAQGYFDYDSKKSGSLTTSHLRIDSKPICSPYAIESADFSEFVTNMGNEYLEMYNEYLKKLDALVSKREAAEARAKKQK